MKSLVIIPNYCDSRSTATHRYMTEIGRLPIITDDQEKTWMQQYRNGSQVARDKLVRAHLRFVVSVAKQYRYPGTLLDDLISEGNIGLMRAIETFDESRGIRLLSYAVHRIRKRIQIYIAHHTTSAPGYRDGKISYHRYEQAWRMLTETLQREPSEDELAEALEVSSYYVHRFAHRRWACASLQEPQASSEHRTLEDILSSQDRNPVEILLADHERTVIKRWLAQLSERQRFVITEYFGLEGNPPRDVFSIADSLGTTHQRVSQMKEGVLRRFRMEIKRSQTEALKVT